MKLLVDLSDTNEITGSITIYSIRILNGFRDNGYKDIIILCNPVIYEYIKLSYPNYKCIIANSDKGKLWKNGLAWSKQVNKIDCDIIFSTKGWLSSLFSKKRVIRVVHDIQRLKTEHGIQLWKYRFFWPLVLLKSYKIITISEFVKNDILNTFPFIPCSKIKVIYNSIALNKPNNKVSPISDKYILYVSRLVESKNVITLIKALDILKNDITHKVVIIGKSTNYWEREVLPYIKKNKLESRIIHIKEPISEDEIIQYYSCADLFVHPSLMEGFGYPPVEAAILGTPVLTTKVTSLYEVTMGLTNYYDPPTDAQMMAKRIKELLLFPISQKKLDEISIKLQHQYEYKQQAEKIYNFINEVY